jgi:hypothetical protein
MSNYNLILINQPFPSPSSLAPATTMLLLSTVSSTFLYSTYGWDHPVFLSFCPWFISLNIIISSSIHVVSNDRIWLFLWYSHIPLCICTRFSLSVHQLTDRYLEYIFDILTSFSLDMYPGVRLLAHKAVLFLIFWGASILFSIMAVLIYIPTNSEQGSLFSTSLPSLVGSCDFKKFSLAISAFLFDCLIHR